MHGEFRGGDRGIAIDRGASGAHPAAGRIRAGSDWQVEISQAITQAKVAILLISASFLTTDFILDKEVPALLQRRDREGLIIFPVIGLVSLYIKLNIDILFLYLLYNARIDLMERTY